MAQFILLTSYPQSLRACTFDVSLPRGLPLQHVECDLVMCNSAMDCHGEESWDMALKMLADLPLADATWTATGWEFCGWGS